MAKKSMIAREVKRKKLVQKYAAKRKSLLDEFNAAKDPMERLEIHRKIQGSKTFSIIYNIFKLSLSYYFSTI